MLRLPHAVPSQQIVHCTHDGGGIQPPGQARPQGHIRPQVVPNGRMKPLLEPGRGVHQATLEMTSGKPIPFARSASRPPGSTSSGRFSSSRAEAPGRS